MSVLMLLVALGAAVLCVLGIAVIGGVVYWLLNERG